MLGAEAVGAIVIHESNSLTVTAPVVIAAIMLTVWLLDSGLDNGVKKWNWAADLIGIKPRSKVKIHGYWYSAVRDHNKNLLGGSLFFVHAGIDTVDFSGVYKDLTVAEDDNAWAWWTGEGAPYGSDAILYAYEGEEDGSEDDGYGKYMFPRVAAAPQIVRGSFYGKNLPDGERDRVVYGERVPKQQLTHQFLEDPEARKAALGAFLARQHSASPRTAV